MRYAVIGCDANEAYSFFLPMTATLWRRLGFTPLFILVDQNAWMTPTHQLELDYLCDAHIAWAPPHTVERTATVAQVSRLFAANLPFIHANDQLITTDADTWPLGAWIGNASGELQLYNVNLYPLDPHWPAPAHFPMCYVAANASVWRELMGTAPFTVGLHAALNSCQAGKPPDVSPQMWTWTFDERLLSERVTSWLGFPQRCVFIPRNSSCFGEASINRYRFNVPKTLAAFADAHLPRPGFADAWPQLRALLALAVGARAAEKWDRYRQEYVDCLQRSRSRCP
jgi:hypothetical protein